MDPFDTLDTLGSKLAQRGFGRPANLLRAGRDLMARHSGSTLLGPDGQIDFVHGRCFYSKGPFWKFFTPEHDYDGEPGEWEVADRDDMTEEDPFWLLALLEATVEAEAGAVQLVLGTECTSYRGFANFELVKSRTLPQMRRPTVREDVEPDRLPIAVWLDSDGRIRRATCREGSLTMELELSDFGLPTPISEPAPEEIVVDDPDSGG